MKKTITLTPSYGTTNTVRFDEEGTTEVKGLFTSAKANKGVLGTPLNEYFDEEQLAAMGWVPSHVGEPYETEPNRKGQTYTRIPVAGPAIKVTFEIA